MENILKATSKETSPQNAAGRKTKTKELRQAAMEEKKAGKLLVEELRDILEQISFNERWFQLECDENLIDACIYEGESLRARYRYLLMKARSMGIQNTPFNGV